MRCVRSQIFQASHKKLFKAFPGMQVGMRELSRVVSKMGVGWQILWRRSSLSLSLSLSLYLSLSLSLCVFAPVYCCFTQVHVHTIIYTCLHTRTPTYKYICTCIYNIYTYIYIYVGKHVCICTRTYMYTYVYAYTYAHISAVLEHSASLSHLHPSKPRRTLAPTTSTQSGLALELSRDSACWRGRP